METAQGPPLWPRHELTSGTAKLLVVRKDAAIESCVEAKSCFADLPQTRL